MLRKPRKTPVMIEEYTAAERRVFDQFIADGHKTEKLLREKGRVALADIVANAVKLFAEHRPRPMRWCAVCGKKFKIKSPWSRVCSDECRKIFRRRQCIEYYENNREKVLEARRKHYRKTKEAKR